MEDASDGEFVVPRQTRSRQTAAAAAAGGRPSIARINPQTALLFVVAAMAAMAAMSRVSCLMRANMGAGGG